MATAPQGRGSSRHLILLQREVAEADRPAYDALWERLRGAARDAGANAWRFAAASDRERFTEFVEWVGPTDPRQSSAVGNALGDLDRFARARSSEWTSVETE